MALATIITPFAVPIREIATFSAPDPWTQTPATTWHLDLCVITAVLRGTVDSAVARAERAARKDSPGPGGRALARGEALALWQTPSGKSRMLPRMLSASWQRGECPTELLPATLHAIAPRLNWSDFSIGGALRSVAHWLALGNLLAAVGYFAIYLWLAPPRTHRPRDVGRADWVVAPTLPPQEVWLQFGVKADGSQPWPGTPTVPAGIAATRGPYRLGWYTFGPGRRLIAWQGTDDGRSRALNYGTVWRPDKSRPFAGRIADVAAPPSRSRGQPCPHGRMAVAGPRHVSRHRGEPGALARGCAADRRSGTGIARVVGPLS